MRLLALYLNIQIWQGDCNVTLFLKVFEAFPRESFFWKFQKYPREQSRSISFLVMLTFYKVLTKINSNPNRGSQSFQIHCESWGGPELTTIYLLTSKQTMRQIPNLKRPIKSIQVMKQNTEMLCYFWQKKFRT